MTELLMELVDKWSFIIAALAVGCTETLMRATRESITRRKYAMLTTVGIATAISVLISFKQELVTLQDGLVRGGISAVISIVAYDGLKGVIIKIPFLQKVE